MFAWLRRRLGMSRADRDAAGELVQRACPSRMPTELVVGTTATANPGREKAQALQNVTALQILPASILPAPNMTSMPQSVRAAAGRNGRPVVPPTLPIFRVTVGVAGPRTGTAPREARRGETCWVPAGRSVTVRGVEIQSGMVYVGSSMSAAPTDGWSRSVAVPCLIDPKLKVGSLPSGPPTDTVYWPSYANISAVQRAAYLHWLSTGKCDPSYPVGYAFLYFYGLERRLLVDGPDQDEEAMLVAEVRRLRELFSKDGSFRGHTTTLLDVVDLRRTTAGPEGLNAWKPDLTSTTRSGPMHRALQLKLGLHALHRVPVDCEHATAAMLALSPYQGGPPSSIAMTRCRDEFVELLRRRFPARFPKGFMLRDRQNSILHPQYHSASQLPGIEIRVQGIERLPDPATLNWAKMSMFCTQTAQDLAPYAKLVGKDRDRRNSMAAALALPPDIADLGAAAAFRCWLDSLPEPLGQVPVAALGAWCFGGGKEAGSLKQAREMSAILALVGYGMEPDPTHGGGKPDADLLVFRLGGSAAVLLSLAFHLAAVVASVLASAEPGPDPDRVVSELAARLRLGGDEATRLAARYRSMQGQTLRPGKLKALAGTLPEVERAAIASLAIAAAANCGEVSQATMAVLERLHDAWRLDRRGLYVALHREAAATFAPASEPVVVEQRADRTGAFRIPSRPERPRPASSPADGLVIDMDKVGAILRETQEVAEVLASIYEEDDETTVVPARQTVAEAVQDGGTVRYPGLDVDHARLVEELRGREEWSRSDFEARARAIGLMPDGAIETMNEWAYDSFDEALVEDGDPLTINVALLSDVPGGAA